MVDDASELPEIMQIGHSKVSHTFIPQVKMVTKVGMNIMDCPGFIDNRGGEINIANAVNTKVAVGAANGIRILVLIGWDSIKADRGRGLGDMIQICTCLFGSEEQLQKYAEQGSILVGVSKYPPDDDDLEYKRIEMSDPNEKFEAFLRKQRDAEGKQDDDGANSDDENETLPENALPQPSQSGRVNRDA